MRTCYRNITTCTAVVDNSDIQNRGERCKVNHRKVRLDRTHHDSAGGGFAEESEGGWPRALLGSHANPNPIL